MTTARDHYLHPIASIRPPAVDGSGNVYVAGTIGAYGYVGAATFGGSSYTLTPTGLEDGWVWMLNSSGTTEWVAQADGSGATVVLQGVNITSSGLISTGGYFDGTQYDAQGNPYLVTSYNGSGWIVNQVEDLYNGFGQLVQEFQAVSGVVTSSTPYVEYNYTDAADGNNSRLTSIEYSDGYTVDYNYASGVDATISRLSNISDFTGTLQSYTYMGVGTVVDQDDNQPNVALNYVTPGSSTDAGDEVTGLDRYGRVIDQNWQFTSGDTTETIAEDRYTYDDDGNVLTKTDEVHSAFTQDFTYNSLNELSSYTETGVSQSGSWAYDALGNMTDVTTDGTSQSRTVNAQNEYTSISGASATPGYDANGNMTADQNGLHYVYNAWNELVDVYNSSSETSAHLVESMTYDGMGRLVTDTAYSGESSTTTMRYYSSEDQVLEEHVGSAYTTRYVWSPFYVNDMVLRDTSSYLTPTGDDYDRLYALQDADYNVVALVNTSGSVVERYDYTPFGSQTIYNSSYTAIGSSAYTWVYGFQGERYDTITMLNEMDERWYSAALARWTANDPLGFAAGQANLYEMEGNDPSNGLDPNGTESQNTVVTAANAQSHVLPPAKVTLPGGVEATIEVEANVATQVKTPEGKVIPESSRSEGAIVIRLTAKNGCKSCRWLQFKYGETYVDSSDPTATDPYYGALGIGGRTDTFSWIQDKPTIATRGVCGGRVQYHVHWEIVFTLKDGKWDPVYEKPTGEATNKLPSWASASYLPRGYKDPGTNNELDPVKNPVDPADRTK